MIAKTARDKETYAAGITSQDHALRQELDALSGIVTPEDQKKIADFTSVYQQWLDNNQTIVDLSRENSNVKARRLSGKEGRQAFNTALTAMQAIAEANDQAMQADRQASAETYATARLLTVWALIVSISIAVAIALKLSIGISHRLRAMGAVAKNIAIGNINQNIDVSSRDEIGTLTRGLYSNGTKNWEVFPRSLSAVCEGRSRLRFGVARNHRGLAMRAHHDWCHDVATRAMRQCQGGPSSPDIQRSPHCTSAMSTGNRS